MWRRMDRKEYHYVCRMEEKMMKHKFIRGLVWTGFVLVLILSATAINKIKENDRMSYRWQVEGLILALKAIGSKEVGKADEQVIQEKTESLALARRKLDHTYQLLYIVECLITTAVYIGYCHGIYLDERRFLKGRLLVQEGVCTGKKEVYYRIGESVTINLVTQEGEHLSDVRIPNPVHRKIECDTSLMLVRNSLGPVDLAADDAGPDPVKGMDTRPKIGFRIYPSCRA